MVGILEDRKVYEPYLATRVRENMHRRTTDITLLICQSVHRERLRDSKENETSMSNLCFRYAHVEGTRNQSHSSSRRITSLAMISSSVYSIPYWLQQNLKGLHLPLQHAQFLNYLARPLHRPLMTFALCPIKHIPLKVIRHLSFTPSA